MRFPFYTLFLREVSSCGFHFTHLFSVKYLHVISILHTISPSSISMRFPFHTLFLREVSPCGFHFTHFFSVKYLHVVSILHTFSLWSIFMRFPFYTLFHHLVSPCGFILHTYSCQKMVSQSLNWTDSVAICATRTEIHGRLFKLWYYVHVRQ